MFLCVMPISHSLSHALPPSLPLSLSRSDPYLMMCILENLLNHIPITFRFIDILVAKYTNAKCAREGKIAHHQNNERK